MLVNKIVFAMALMVFGGGMIEATTVHAQSTKKAKTKELSKAGSKKKSAEKAEVAEKAAAPVNEPPKAVAPAQPVMPPTPKNDESTVIGKAKVAAKQSGLPLVVFGTSERCHRTAKLREGLSSQPELKLLMTQYVSVDIPFGGKEFATEFQDIAFNSNFKERAIGSPSVFIFSAKGEVLYAGPNSPEGTPPDERFKELLVSGIAQNGGLHGVPSSTSLVPDIESAESLIASNKLLEAAVKMAKYASLSSSSGSNGDLTQLAELTKTTLPDSATMQRLSALMQQLSLAGTAKIEATANPQAEPIQSAVQLVELQHAFAGYPGFADKCEDAWNKLASSSQQQSIKAQAELFHQARQEEASDKKSALKTYRKIAADYPGSKTEEYAKQRITDLSGPQVAEQRQWKNKSGKFSVTASLVGSDGKSIKLFTDKGQTITVKIDVLSEDDQKYLKSVEN